MKEFIGYGILYTLKISNMIDVICSVQGQKKCHQGPPKLALHLKNCISKQLAKKLLMSVQLSSASGQKVKAISVKNIP